LRVGGHAGSFDDGDDRTRRQATCRRAGPHAEPRRDL